jgi:hypothetical protein
VRPSKQIKSYSKNRENFIKTCNRLRTYNRDLIYKETLHWFIAFIRPHIQSDNIELVRIHTIISILESNLL